MSDGLTRRHVLEGIFAVTLGACAKTTPNAASSASGGWATGGTAAMKGVAFPDPFPTAGASRADLTCAATLGPCYAKSIERKDISEGQAGLPTRLAFLVVNASGDPVPGAEVDVWHAAPKGVYSGDDAAEMCTNRDPEALRARFFRGRQNATSAGRVDFDTCFPGWYRGRTVHIHFTVRVNGVELVTSQLGFDDKLVDELMTSQPLYKERGARDTTNATDGIIGAKNIFDTQRLPSGVLLASTKLVLRATSSDVLCTIEGRDGPGGGPPPGGFAGDGGRPPGPPGRGRPPPFGSPPR